MTFESGLRSNGIQVRRRMSIIDAVEEWEKAASKIYG